MGVSTASQGIVRVGSDVSRRGVLGNVLGRVLNDLESSADKPAVLRNVLLTIRVDVTHFAAVGIDI